MRAALLERFGAPVRVVELPSLELGTGEVIVDVVATPVLSYSRDVLSGARQYVLPLPSVPGGGAVGRVRAVGPDATQLAVGDWVFCDPTVRARDNPLAPDIVLQGITASSARSTKLQQHFRHGAWAEQMRVPTENAVPIGAIGPEEALRWSAIGRLLVPYGGLAAGEVQPGETVVVNGASGAFGSAGVMVALALGARAVLATGRNEAVLSELARRLGARVVPVVMRGDEEADRARILAAAPAPIDCVLDLLPPAATVAQVRTAALTVRPNGRVVLMGGVREELPLPYGWLMRNNVTVRGQWMYSPAAVGRLSGLIRAGLIDLGLFEVNAFPLARVSEAVEQAANRTGLFEVTVLTPNA